MARQTKRAVWGVGAVSKLVSYVLRLQKPRSLLGFAPEIPGGDGNMAGCERAALAGLRCGWGGGRGHLRQTRSFG